MIQTEYFLIAAADNTDLGSGVRETYTNLRQAGHPMNWYIYRDIRLT
jgi:hypothetical protein